MINNCFFVDCQQTYYYQIFKREDSDKTEMTLIRIDDKHEVEQNQSIYVEIVRVKPWDGAISKIREAEYDFSQIQPHIFMNVPHP
jgi:hypothetical protein